MIDKCSLVVSIALLGFTPDLLAQTSANIFPQGNMVKYSVQCNPWAGVDGNGNLRGLFARQFAVDDNGKIAEIRLSPSIAVGDLNGDGLPDLVVADPKGFFWYFPNSGVVGQPKFTSGEVMPIWLGSVPGTPADPTNGDSQGTVDRTVPRIQLIDFAGERKLDIVAGTFAGQLFYLQNHGTATQPKFDVPKDLNLLRPVPLRSDGRLDCNYLSPFLYDWFGNGILQLVRGDGTYSANSIFLYQNKGSNLSPVFNEQNQTKIIPGLGREHLTPQVIDWNNDGKPDIITGERTGQIELFLNMSSDLNTPTFAEGQKLKFGNQDQFGQFTTVTTASLNKNPKVPDVLFSNSSGNIFLCRNTGTPGSPQFQSPPQVLKGVNPFPKILVSDDWILGGYGFLSPEWFASFHDGGGTSEGSPFGVPYELLVVTNAAQEPGFAPPQGETWKNALKYTVFDPKNRYFQSTYYPAVEDGSQVHTIRCLTGVTLTSETRYQLSFWMKGEGVHDISYNFKATQVRHPGVNDGQINFVTISNSESLSSSWSQVNETISWDTTNGKTNDTTLFFLEMDFFGQGNLYVADMQIQKAP